MLHECKIKPEKQHPAKKRDVLLFSLVENRLRFVKTIQALIGGGKILLAVRIFGIQADGFTGIGQCLLELPHALVLQRDVISGHGIARINIFPLLVSFDRLPYIRHEFAVVMGGNIKPLPLARAVLQVERFLQILFAQRILREVSISNSERRIRHSKIRIEFDGALEWWNRTVVVQLQMRSLTQAERLQRIKGRGCGLLKRRGEFLQRGNRLAEFAAQI